MVVWHHQTSEICNCNCTKSKSLIYNTCSGLYVDHERLLVGGLSSSHHLIDGVARVADRLRHVDPQHGPRVEPERLVLVALNNLESDDTP